MNAVKCSLFQRVVLIGLVAAALGTAPAARAVQINVTNSVCIRAGLKWDPKFWFRNLDDPLPPPDYRPNDKHRVRKWYYRNSLHNFDFYIIGLADKTFRRSGRFPGDVFNPRAGWNWAVCKHKWVRLPFVSYHRRHFQFYFGWRERGNFGIKLTFDKQL